MHTGLTVSQGKISQTALAGWHESQITVCSVSSPSCSQEKVAPKSHVYFIIGVVDSDRVQLQLQYDSRVICIARVI